MGREAFQRLMGPVDQILAEKVREYASVDERQRSSSSAGAALDASRARSRSEGGSTGTPAAAAVPKGVATAEVGSGDLVAAADAAP